MRGGYSASMRIVAILSVAFVVLVGVVAVTYPNESDEVRQRNAAYMKLDGIKGESVKAGVEREEAIADWFGGGLLTNPTTCTRTFTDTTAKNKAATELNRDPVFRARIACVCQDLDQISRIVEKLDSKNPVAADLRVAVERAKNNLAAGVWTNGSATSLKAATDRDAITEDRPTSTDGDVNDMVFQACDWGFATVD